MTEVVKIQIAPRFDRAELDEIDKYRGERTKTEYVHDSVIVQMDLNCKILPYLEEAAKLKGDSRNMNQYIADALVSYNSLNNFKAITEKRKAVVLKHDCGAKYDVLTSGNDVFLLCGKCHKSKRMTKAEYEAAILANCQEQTVETPLLPSTTPPSINQTATS